MHFVQEEFHFPLTQKNLTFDKKCGRALFFLTIHLVLFSASFFNQDQNFFANKEVNDKYAMARVAMEHTSKHESLWCRYVEDLAIRRFNALDSEADRRSGEEDSHMYMVNLFWTIPGSADKERRFVQLHVLAYFKYHQLVQQVMLLRPFQIMSTFECNEKLMALRRRVRVDSLSPDYSYAPSVTSVDSTVSSSGELFSVYFYCGNILPHLNEMAPDMNEALFMNKFYSLLSVVSRFKARPCVSLHPFLASKLEHLMYANVKNNQQQLLTIRLVQENWCHKHCYGRKKL